jgi:hypothetical protein
MIVLATTAEPANTVHARAARFGDREVAWNCTRSASTAISLG